MKRILSCFLSMLFIHAAAQQSPLSLKDEVRQDVMSSNYGEALDKLEGRIDEVRSDTTGLFEALVNLYLFEKNWKDLIRVCGLHTFKNGEDSTALSMARFYARHADEQISGLPATLPFKSSVSGTPEINVKINGKTYRFWFDTGAGITVLSSRTASHCKVKTGAGSGAAMAATGKAVGVVPAMIDSLQIGSMKVLNHACMVINKKDLEFKVLGIRVLKIDGIIGWNLLQELDVAIRNRTKTIELAEPETVNRDLHNFFWLDQPLIACTDSAGKDCLFFIDTGASTSDVYQDFINKSDTAHAIKKTVTVGSAGGVSKLRTYVFPQVKLTVGGSNLILKNVSGLPHDDDGIFPCDGVLGINAFKNWSIHFNLMKGFFAVED